MPPPNLPPNLPLSLSLDATTLPVLARGCAVLGSGGGGGTEVTLAAALQAVADHGPVPVVAPEELPADALVMPCGVIGSPVVSAERIGGPDQAAVLRDTVERLHGVPVAALMSGEIGGGHRGTVPGRGGGGGVAA